MRIFEGRARKRVAAGLATLAMVALAACSSSDSSGDAVDSKPSLKLAILSTSAITATAYIAEVKGFYDDFGVDVELMDNTGNNSLNYIVSGDADLTLMASTGPLMLKQRGKEAVIVASSTGGAAGGFLIGGKDVKKIEDLKGARIATLGKGTSVYGHAALYSEKYDLNADLVPFESPAAAAAAVKSGQVKGAAGPYAAFGQLINDGSVNVLIDSRDPEIRAEKIGPDFAEGALFGRRDIVEKKRDAVTRTLAAIDAAQTYMEQTDPIQVAKDLRTLDAFKTTPEDVLASLLENSMSHMHINDGMMTEENWAICLEQFDKWGISDFDSTNPDFAYDKIVDMSYLEESQKLKKS